MAGDLLCGNALTGAPTRGDAFCRLSGRSGCSVALTAATAL